MRFAFWGSLAMFLFAAISANAALTQSDGCYLIGSADDLYQFNRIYSSYDDDTLAMRLDCVKLTQDIVVNENVLKEDGSPNAGPFKEWESINHFSGTFDGQNHTISGLYQLKTEYSESVGFILSAKGTIKNLGIVDSYFAVDFNESLSFVSAGSLAASASDTLTIENCFSAATVEMYEISKGVGGLVGDARKLLVVRNSHNEGKVFVTDEKMIGKVQRVRLASAGGLVGYSSPESVVRIEKSYNNGPVSGAADVGGLVGWAEKKESSWWTSEEDLILGKVFIEESFNSGNINAFSYEIGGLIGRGQGVIKDSYNVGAVAGSYIVGGLVGFVGVDTLLIENAFNKGTLVAHDTTDRKEVQKYYEEVNSFTGGLVGRISNAVVLISNAYSASENYSGKDTLNSIVGIVDESHVRFDNVFYRKSQTAQNDISAIGLSIVDESLFNNGIVATQLHLGNKIWGQKSIGEGSFPDLSGIVNASIRVNSITWHSFDGDTIVYPANYVEGMGLALPQDILRDGYLFDGWYAVANPTSSDSRIERIKADETGKKTFYAKWLKLNAPKRDGECYQIADVVDLYSFASIVNGTNGMKQQRDACGKLTQDIVVNEQVLNSEGELNSGRAFRKWTPMNDFAGAFDGDGHTISGLYLDDSKAESVGFIAKIDHQEGDTVEIKNLGFENFYFKGGENVGGLVGIIKGSGDAVLLTNLRMNGLVVGKKGVGGFVGWIDDYVEFSNCFNLGTVRGSDENVGGFVGHIYEASVDIRRSYNSGKVWGGSHVGGFAGRIYHYGTLSILESYNVGEIRGVSSVGGLAGEGYGYPAIKVKNCYNNGVVSGLDKVGGIIGYFRTVAGGADILNSYNSGKIILESADAKYGSLIGMVSGGGYAVENSFYLKQEGFPAYGADDTTKISIGWTEVSEEKLYDGTVAELLHNWVEVDGRDIPVEDGEDGFVWAVDPQESHVLPHLNWENTKHRVGFVLGEGGKIAPGHELTYYEEGVATPLPDSQFVTREGYIFKYWCDSYYCFNRMTTVDPNKTGVQVFYAEWEVDTTLISSSSEVASSSSEASSSSVEQSSSSAVKSSSSSAPKQSSSSEKSDKSSSSSKGKSSSSKTNSIEMVSVPQFSVTVLGDVLQVAGARVGAKYALFDIQGNMVLRGTANSASFNVNVPTSGSYVLRIGNGSRKVRVFK